MLARNPAYESPQRSHPHGFAARLRTVLYAARAPFLWLLFAAGLAAMLLAGVRWTAERHDNRIIATLLGGENVAIDPNTASPRVLFAKSYYLLKRDRVEEAQILLDQANFRADPATRVAMLYNMANVRVRAAFEAIDQGAFDNATSFIELAKQDYNQALRLDPDAWDVKYNLDVAARLVRDLPEGVPSEEEPQQTSKKLWTDLPGVPKGEP
jgi:mxaK protein